ncbi:MAG TPA: polysaccharide biosynthesis protein [Gaiellaceae bacterium]|jgi:FlaA1/EpsC-like NDP-sugar epimerase|nr:polysaccharide biosynthesis protein [Gaiellaceae bacterium]
MSSLRSIDGLGAASRLERILGRPERPLPLDEPLARLAGKRILITGAKGSIGTALLEHIEALATDVDSLDVRDEAAVEEALAAAKPELIFHMAAAKSAPDGERDPMSALEINVIGTRNVLAHAPDGCRVVTASTCKACEPETAYGASKLVAERVTLNAGGSVSRFYNVVESSGNVFEIWSQLGPDEPIPVTPCRRYFISLAEAVSLVLWTAMLPPARYGFDPGTSRELHDVAAALYPHRAIQSIPPRRGDRLVEPLAARHEHVEQDAQPSLLRIVGAHDLEATGGRLEPAVRRLAAQ